MLIAPLLLALCALAPAPMTPRIVVEQGSAVRSARTELTHVGGQAALVCRFHADWPPLQSRRTAVLEGLDAAGHSLFTQTLTPAAQRAAARFHRDFEVQAIFTVPARNDVALLRVRLAP